MSSIIIHPGPVYICEHCRALLFVRELEEKWVTTHSEQYTSLVTRKMTDRGFTCEKCQRWNSIK